MECDTSLWAGRAGWRPRPGVLRLPHDVLLEVACLLDIPALLSLRQACRELCAITREPVIFVRLLASARHSLVPRLVPPTIAPPPEQRVVRAYRLHKNWDLASLPVTVRTARADAVVPLNRAPLPHVVSRPVPVQPTIAAPLPYHLPPGADAYPFLKLETYAPFRDTAAKSNPSARPTDSMFVNATPVGLALSTRQGSAGSPHGLPSHPHSAHQSPADPSHQTIVHPSTAPQQIPIPPNVGNFAAAAVRAWQSNPPAPSLSHSETPSSSISSLSVPGPSSSILSGGANNLCSSASASSFGSGPAHCAPSSAPTPPPAPAPRPTRVASVPIRAIFARIVGGGRWGVFVVKRLPASETPSRDKGKQRADSYPLTAVALASLSVTNDKRKGKVRAAPVDPQRVAQWAGESTSGSGAAPAADPGAKTGTSSKGDGETFLVIYDLDVAGSRSAGTDLPEKGKMAEFPLRWTPAAMTCRNTANGVVVVVVRGTPEGTSYTSIVRWPYLSSTMTHLGTHKSGCLLGAMSIREYEVQEPPGSEAGGLENPGLRTLVAIVHRPRTVMIQDIDTSQRCFLKLSKVPPVEHRHTLQSIHLLPGLRILALRTIQAEEPAYVLEEYAVPGMGETASPIVPVQRQWIRGFDLHSCLLCEGPSYENGSEPDIALWAFSTLPNRAVVHWVLRPGPKTVLETDQVAEDTPAVQKDIYADDATYMFPAERVSANRLSFPHHKATLAPGARRAMWFERPERSRVGEAKGMRGVWGYSAVASHGGLADSSVARNCTRELPDDVLSAMESNTLGVAFDESSGRALVLTCGDGYTSTTGCKVWILDYA